MATGAELLDELERNLSVEPGWVVIGPGSRTWWLTDLPQRIWADPIVELGGGQWIRLHASAVVATGVIPSAQTYEAIAAENMASIMSALVLDAGRGELSLHCQATFDANRPGGGRLDLFRTAALFQAAVADLYDRALSLPGGTRPRVPHPTSGLREGPAELVATLLPAARQLSETRPSLDEADLEAVQAGLDPLALWSILGTGRLSMEVDAGSALPRMWFAAVGDSDESWDREYADQLREMVRDVAAEKGEDPAVFHQMLWGSLEAATAPQTAAVRVSTVDDHPYIGRGLLSLILLPGQHTAREACRLANGLNLREIDGNMPMTQFGAWAARDAGGSWQLAYSGFVTALFLSSQSSEDRVTMVSDLTGEVLLRAGLAMEYLRGAAGRWGA